MDGNFSLGILLYVLAGFLFSVPVEIFMSRRAESLKDYWITVIAVILFWPIIMFLFILWLLLGRGKDGNSE